METSQLLERCNRVRRDIILLTATAGSGHPGGSLSCTEIIVAVYNKMRVNPKQPHDPSRDRFVLSKGHCAPALYATLCDMGFFDRSAYDTYRKFGGILQGHPDSKRTPGIDVCTGSLGQGISMAVGMALGAKHDHKDINVYTVLGDGELQEGIVWEALMAAAHYKLDNLTVIIDNNRLQIDGTNDEVMSLGDIHSKVQAFGLSVTDVANGNDIYEIVAALDAPAQSGKPRCILAHTIKGKGVSFMENEVGWHGKAPDAQQRDAALAELGEL